MPRRMTSLRLRFILCAGLAGGLLTGCGTPSRPNRRVYDRYAELVAERNRALQQAAVDPAAAPAAAPARSRAADIQAPPPAAARPVPSRPAAAPEPAAERPRPAPAPAEAPPVQVVAPDPAQKPAPAPRPAPARTPSPEARPAPEPAAALPAASADGSAEDSNAYTLKQGDMVQVFLRGIPSAEAIEGLIDEHGMITLPFINEVVAEGQTASELARTIRRIYQEQGIYRNISVNVVVPTRFYFIQGEIRSPGRFQIVSATRLSQAIAAAGGYTEFASGRVLVKRGGKIFKTIRNARRLERAPKDDILLEPDDIVEVQRSLW